MVMKPRQWLEGLALTLTSRQLNLRNKEIPPLNLNDLAFTLATADSISETLPEVIPSIQQTIDTFFKHKERGDIFILFAKPISAESFLHHSCKNKPSPQFIEELHRIFTLKKTSKKDIIDIKTNNISWKIVPRKLLENEHLNVWLLFTFKGLTPSIETLKWKTSAIENALTKGIKAWHQREEKITSALQAERAIYAAELHDSLAQVLGYLRLKSAKLDKMCSDPQYQTLKPISEDLAAYTHCAYRQTRELITSSRLTMQTENLSQGVINSIQEFEQQSAIVFELDNRMLHNMLTPKQSMQILYIVRESLSNTIRHSHASHSRVILNFLHNKQLQVIIEDNGTGIAPEAARCDSFGLQIMRERAERIGATLSIGHRLGGGTRTELVLDMGEHYE